MLENLLNEILEDNTICWARKDTGKKYRKVIFVG